LIGKNEAVEGFKIAVLGSADEGRFVHRGIVSVFGFQLLVVRWQLPVSRAYFIFDRRVIIFLMHFLDGSLIIF
jgi:hypothetical protein